jgi:hypothetical protein
MKKLLFLAIASMALFSACKKKDVEKTTAEKITGSWKFINVTYNFFYGATSHLTSYDGITGDYFDFRADGKVYLQVRGNKDTAAYSILSDNKIKFDGDDFDIKVLTENQFIIYNKDIDPRTPTDYQESTYTLAK